MKTWTFCHIADMQPGSPRSFRFNPAWEDHWQTAQKQLREINPELLIVGGDVTRDGSIHDFELEKAKADFDALPFPCHVIPGNMDTGNKHAPCQGAYADRNDPELNVTSDQLGEPVGRQGTKQNADQLNHAHSEAALSGWKASLVAAKSIVDKRRRCL